MIWTRGGGRFGFSPSLCEHDHAALYSSAGLYKWEVPLPEGAVLEAGPQLGESAHVSDQGWAPSCLEQWGSHRAAHTTALGMPSRTVPYSRFSPRQRRRRLLAERSVHFPNDVLFLDHIRQGDLVQVGRFIRARKVALDTIHPSGE